MEINIIKRDGTKEAINYEKINKVLLWAVENINGVSASNVAMNAQLQFYNGIKSSDIHKLLIQSAVELVTENEPNYQYVASNLLNYYIRKNIFNTATDMPHIKTIMVDNVARGIYDEILLKSFTNEELEKINSFIKHERDFNFTWAGLQQMVDKYLLKDRLTGEIYETPQYAYMFIAMTLFADFKGDKVNMIKGFYNQISKWKISLPTPIMCGVRTPNRQYSSCTLIDCGDSLESIYSTNSAIGYYTAKRAGIGINVGRIRAIGAPIRGGEVVHTGVIPFLKMFESTTRSCTQNGVRGGSSTTFIPFWHKEIEDVLVLKNNKGTDDNRVRKMDYGIQFSKLFYKRFINNETVTLFSAHEVKDLYDAFGYNDIFDELYVKYENDNTKTKKTVSARELFNQFCQERIGTGRIYLMNIDNANEHSSFLDKVYQSNLCMEIDLPTSPLNHIDDGKVVTKLIKMKSTDVETFVKLKNEHTTFYIDGKTNNIHKKTLKDFNNMFTIIDAFDTEMSKNNEYTILPQKFEMMWGEEPAEIALCVLSAINLGTIKELSELEEVCEFTLRALDFVITHQDYPVEAAKKMLARRSVGVGVTNLAYYFAKNGVIYGSQESLGLLDETMEYIQYYLIKASVKLAKEFGKCEYFNRTKYSKGILPIDTYCNKVDTIVSREKSLDWEELRAEVLEHGMRNSTLTAMMPCESSSVVSNSTNGIEPPRSLITSKKSKQGIIKMAVPEVYKLKNKYKLAFDVTNKEYTNIQAVIQKWIDQGISGNHYYSMENGESLSITEVVKDLLYFYNMGGKQLYYANTSDGKTDDITKMMKEEIKAEPEIEEEIDDCAGGACKL
jgi:ribonucleoside-diphosphate reductase alpha subunit